MAQGHKRWDKAVVNGYESIRRLAHEHLLPALERFIVLASRLRGLAKFQISNRNLGLPSQDLEDAIDTIGCLQLIAHEILIITTAELRQFQAFSIWLRQEIDIQASGSNSSESPETAMNIDHASTLQYVQGAMTRSGLLQMLDVQETSDQDVQWGLGAGGGSLFDFYKTELKKQIGHDQTAKKIPQLSSLIGHLSIQCDRIFQSIAETQRRNVRFGPSVLLCNGIPDIMDVRLLQEVIYHSEYGHELKLPKDCHTNTNDFTQFVAVGLPPRKPQCQSIYTLTFDCVLTAIDTTIFRIAMKIENGMSTIETVDCAQCALKNWRLRDIKFADDKRIILAVSDECKIQNLSDTRVEWGLI